MSACKLKQQELADLLNVPLQRVKRLSGGEAKKFTQEEQAALIDKLDISPSWLITGEGPMFQDDEPQEEFVGRMRAINQARALIAVMPLSETAKRRLGAIMSGDPAQDGLLIAEALRHEFVGQPALQPDEAALLDHYRNSPKEAQDALKATSAALAQSVTRKGKCA